MNRTIFSYLPFVFFVVLIAGALSIAAGPSLAGQSPTGPFLVAHDSLRAMLTTADESPADALVSSAAPLRPLYTVGQQPSAPARPAPMTVPVRIPGAPPALDETCVALHFAGAVSIQDGRVSFGRFTPIQTTCPRAAQDPLTSWKLLQFENLPFTLDITPSETGLKIDKAINLLLIDPFTQTPLLSARWQVEEIAVRGQHAGVNATLRVNLSDIRIDNAINSPVLAQFKSETGVLTMHIEHSEDIIAQIEANVPIFAAMQGTIYAERCLR
ncbi:MAG: hypothetical protein JW934_04825 [Anaerolineae bacterium]|nr:hypothetical protein [Anaerolineae bacterium]